MSALAPLQMRCACSAQVAWADQYRHEDHCHGGKVQRWTPVDPDAYAAAVAFLEAKDAAAPSLAAVTAARRDSEVGEIVAAGARLPAAFYDDHVARDLPAGREVRRSGRSVWVDLDSEAIRDLHSDAWHYETGEDYDRWIRGAARSMRLALDRQNLR